MKVGILQMELMLAGSHSLKDKRSVLRRLKNQVRKKFNVSIAEVEHGNNFKRTLLAITTISVNSQQAKQVLEKTEKYIEMLSNSLVVARKIEMF